jgi:enoyl-CoA hydratase/carnithine racemase
VTETERILVTRDGPVRVLTLNRPDELNPFDGHMHRAMVRILDELADDTDARAVVLTGSGRAFSAGGDLTGFATMADDLEHRRRTLRLGRRLFDDLVSLHLPLITAVNGPAVGLGATLVTTSDIVFMAEGSYLADTHVLVALVAGDGGAITWPTLTSLLKAKQYLLTGDRVPASEAVAMGLANFVVPLEDVVASAVAFAHRIALLPPQAVQDTKVLLNQVLRQGAALSLGFGLAAESQSSDTAEYRRVPAEMAERRRVRDAERGR